MKNLISQLLADAVDRLKADGVLPTDISPSIQVENARDKAHGDFASNLAMMLAKPAGMKPRDLAEKLIAALPAHQAVASVNIAGPGFINFFQDAGWLASQLEAALADPAQSPRERHFLSESSVYRILKAEDLITSPAYVVLSAAKTFAHPTHRPNELWQTDFTCLQVVGWGWYYLSTVLDDYSRYIVAWTLRTSMQASDVTDTLDLARAQAGVDRVRVVHRPRLLSDNGPCYVSQALADLPGHARPDAYPGRAVSPDDAEEDRTLSPVDEERRQAGTLLLSVET